MRMRGALFACGNHLRAVAYCDSDGYALTLYAFSEQPVHDAMVVTTVNAYYKID